MLDPFHLHEKAHSRLVIRKSRHGQGYLHDVVSISLPSASAGEVAASSGTPSARRLSATVIIDPPATATEYKLPKPTGGIRNTGRTPPVAGDNGDNGGGGSEGRGGGSEGRGGGSEGGGGG